MPGASGPARLAMTLAAVEAVERITDDLAGKAARLAPVDTGALRASAVTDVVVHERMIEGTVVFAVPYAAVQHERTDYVHPKGGQAKYLEQPLMEGAFRYEAILGSAIRAALLL